MKVRSVLAERKRLGWVAVMMDPPGVNPFGVTNPQTESPQASRLRQDVAKKPDVGRAYIELLGGRPTCGTLV